MAYLNGMGEAASEVRRYCLDEMRHGDLKKSESILEHMETIYDDLITGRVSRPRRNSGAIRVAGRRVARPA